MQQLDERLKGQYASLSPQEQRVADFIFDHFDDLISYNSAELAQLSGVSKATVSRLFKRLGYDKYKDMRDELRTLRQSGMPLTDQRDAVQGNTLLARHYKQEMANLTQWVNALDARQFAEALTAMVVNLGAYSTEIVRAGIQVTPKGQWEAGRVLGLSRTQTFVRVVLPPALQRIYPALVSQCIIVMLGSSVVSQVSYEELTFAANLIQSRTFLSFEVYLVTTGIYLALSIAMRQLLMAAGRKWLGVQA
ncbi:ABC transporter permease subunit [Klebsiella pneumoniae]|nr:ABC transporter permease subunit [Klebsiella pneumoniae]MBK2486447.1 ABC transporter permease subunit [Klebsiella pneumoniae]MBK2581693.1 ABC transporter permease subunit [Klebsiella pneumoniae]MEE2368754.1 ABC transporter permease subunit [Klebsiella pneumoniae]UZI76063.1 ABC transporter permease subunit [Klebsiella pneumoniae]SYU01145.1 amino acid ABC transporter [Klebsiella pneumoniae]